MVNNLKNFVKMQSAFDELINFLKNQKTDLNDSKLKLYDEIEALRLKYEHGTAAARRYQKRCRNINDEYQRIFVERNINFKRDLDSS